MEKLIEEYKRKLKRTQDRIKEKEAKHKGNEEKYTYHGGFDMGYLKGMETILDDFIYYIEVNNITIN